jgi:hypothetical protein
MAGEDRQDSGRDSLTFTRIHAHRDAFDEPGPRPRLFVDGSDRIASHRRQR